MPVYYSNDFSGIYPVGTSAVVRAKNKVEAEIKLSEALALRGLEFDGTLTELKGDCAVILSDGDY